MGGGIAYLEIKLTSNHFNINTSSLVNQNECSILSPKYPESHALYDTIYSHRVY